MKSKYFNRDALYIYLLVVVSALVYLPNGLRLTYFQDDWYYIYDGLIAGAKVFRTMFAIDRPARGYFFELYFSLFGAQPIFWHVGAYLWRLLGALGALWLFNILWNKERKFAFFAALLFAIHPSYFWWVGGVEYQPMIASLALQVFSMVFTVKVVIAEQRRQKILFIAAAILSGWAYIALVDYAVGMEIFRLLCIYLIIARRYETLLEKIRVTIQEWLAYAAIPMGYLIWRTFFFENQRKATDLGLQLSALAHDPATVLSKWINLLFSSSVTLGLTSWIEQFKRYFLRLDVREVVVGMVIAVFIFIALIIAEKNSTGENTAPLDRTSKEALMLGFFGLTIGIVPVIIANRYVNLDIYSHYGLPASLAAAVLLAGVIHALGNRALRFGFFSAAIILASLTHYALSKQVLNQENAIERFWWQSSWRIPALRPDSTLITQYPSRLGEEAYGLLEPPNLIYFDEPRAEIPVRYPVSAIMPTRQNTEAIESGQRQKMESYRTHNTILNYKNILLLAQPTSESCVRVIDGKKYLPSEFDTENVKRIAPFSNLGIIRSGAEFHTPQVFAFGAEPVREWCYYFEKADFAAQQSQWDEAANLGDKALRLGFSPADPVEWFPFLQAYIMTGNGDKINQIAGEMSKSQFIKEQACLLSSASSLDVKITDKMNELFCK
jgi:hypothetical protein